MSEDEYKQILKTRIDEVLHYIWDPIGISDTPQVRDEYSRYANNVWQAVLEGKSKLEISAYLTTVTTKLMGLNTSKDHNDEVAEIVLDWAQYLKDPYNS